MGIFVVDKRSGKEAIHKLAQKVLEASNIRQRVHMRFAPQGDMFIPEKMRAHFIFLLKQHRDLSKIIACVDSECTDPGQIQPRVDQVQRKLTEFKLGPPIRYVVVVHAVEGWLAADAEAVGQVLRMDVSTHIPANLEHVCKPADLLAEIFEKCGRDFRKTLHDPEIAEHSDPEKIAHRNSSFQHFQNALLDP